MKIRQSWGLVSAGGLSRSFLIRLPALSERLGPIKATSVQAARIISKAFKYGYPASHYSALELCDLIWIAVPDSVLDNVVIEMAAQTPVHRTMVALCDSARDSGTLHALRKSGARIASVNVVEESRERLFVGEGHPDTLRAVKGLLATDKRRLIELHPSAKPLFFAGTHLATHLVLPLVDAAVECLRAAGFERSDAVQVSEVLVRRILTNYSRVGRKAWRSSTGAQLRRNSERYAEMLRGKDRKLARLYLEGIRLAGAHFETDLTLAHSKSQEDRDSLQAVGRAISG